VGFALHGQARGEVVDFGLAVNADAEVVDAGCGLGTLRVEPEGEPGARRGPAAGMSHRIARQRAVLEELDLDRVTQAAAVLLQGPRHYSRDRARPVTGSFR
jgi:hypothetical protein